MTWLKIAPYAVIVALLGWVGWLKYEMADFKLDLANATIKEQRESKEKSDRLIAQVADTLNTLSSKKDTYVEKIYTVPASPDDEACRKSERMRVGSRGVSDIVRGANGSQRGANDAVRGAVSGAGPR